MLFNLIALVLFINLGNGTNYDSFDHNLYQAQSDTQQVEDIIANAISDAESSNFTEARKKLKIAEKLSKDLEYSKGLQKIALTEADIYLNIQFYDSARVVLENTLNDYPQSDYKIQLYNLLATAFRYKNENSKAIEIYKSIIPLAEEKGESRMVAAVHQNMAVAFIEMGNNVEGLNSFLISLEYAEAEKDTSLLVVALNNLGDTYNDFGEYEQAQFYLEKSLNIAKQNNLKLDLLRATTNLANVKSNINELDESLRLYNEALLLSREVRPSTPPFQILFNTGNLYLKMNKPNDAIPYFEESLGYCLQFNISQGVYYNYGGLGDAADQKGDYKEAIGWHKKALEIALENNSLPFIQETYQKLYELNKSDKNFRTALIRLEQYKNLSDSLLDLEKERSFEELKNELELNRQSEINKLLLEKQEQQENKLRIQYGLIVVSGFVILLILYILLNNYRSNKEKEIAFNQLTKQREELEKLNQEMNKLFAIIAHDLRAPLASMQGVLFLLKNGGLSKDEVDEFTSQIENSIQSNIGVMEDLLSWAKEQMSGITLVKEELNLYELIDSVISKQDYRSKQKEVIVQNRVDIRLFILSDENALRLIFRNLLSNSIKYTRPGDSIKFSSTDLEDRVQLCVTDTGLGISKEVQEKVFSNQSISFSIRGTKGEKGTGFGLSLIKEFVNKLEGTITIESEEGKGTKFCIEIPKK